MTRQWGEGGWPSCKGGGSVSQLAECLCVWGLCVSGCVPSFLHLGLALQSTVKGTRKHLQDTLLVETKQNKKQVAGKYLQCDPINKKMN